MAKQLLYYDWACCDYQTTWQKMQTFTDTRIATTQDEVWLLEHPPVFTQGLAGKAEHIINPGAIPVIQTDRGGQVTYHGPGQLVAYILFDLKRLNIGIRRMVSLLEQSVIDLLAIYHIVGINNLDAPGVYVNNAKICSIGLRVKKGCTYHGIALNVAMDLSPFTRINPCGFKQLAMTHMQTWCPSIEVADIKTTLIQMLRKNFNYK